MTRLGEKAYKLADRLDSLGTSGDLYRALVTDWPEWREAVIGANSLPTQLDDSSVVAGVSSEPEHRMMLLDTLTYLPNDILTKVDRAAMGVSLESRVPFLDHRVVELAWRLRLGDKICTGQGKWAVRQIL